MLLLSFVEKTIFPPLNYVGTIYGLLFEQICKGFLRSLPTFFLLFILTFLKSHLLHKTIIILSKQVRKYHLTVSPHGDSPMAQQERIDRSAGDAGSISGSGRSLERECQRILAWEVLWTEESGGPQSMSSQRVGYNWAHMHSYPLVTINFFLRRVSACQS